MNKVVSQSPEDTIAFAAKFARALKPGDIVFLKGDLGAGKTTFMKGIAKALKVDPNQVNSPTFVLMNHYKGKLPMYHFDLYRLEKAEEIKTVQFDEYFYGKGISVIEWPERLGELAPQDFWLVELTHKSEHERQICISCPSKPQRAISL